MFENQYQKIDWSSFPGNYTSFGDTNGNAMDMSLDDLNSSIIDTEEIDNIIKNSHQCGG